LSTQPPQPVNRPLLPGLRIGLTGGIGSGKSTVAQQLVALGAALVDTDAIARQLTAPAGAAMPAITAAFGPSLVAPDGALDRVAMRRLVFSTPQAKAQLEALLHPLIGEQAQRQAQAARDAGASVIVFDVPLLAESRAWRQRVDRVLVVDCLTATQVDRVSQRPGWTEDAAQAVVAQQAPRAVRRRVADAVVYNDGITREALQREVHALWAAWTAKAA
jgi:dephospho-CoA kinase